jgi:hypothetical protein
MDFHRRRFVGACGFFDNLISILISDALNV